MSVAAARWLSGSARPWVLLLSSAAFYTALDARALVAVAFVVLLSWVSAHALVRFRSGIALSVAIFLTLCPLFIAKYVPWIRQLVETGDWWVGASLDSRGVPPGISFVALQAVGLVVDVWRGRCAPSGLRDHALFLAFFPQLVAGPIERAETLVPQLANPVRPGAVQLYTSGKLLLWGYALKLCIADQIAGPIEQWLRLPAEQAPAGLALALPLFSARLYLDFYAYSCIAVALGMAHGIHLTQNFANPYGAAGVAEFWRRWHISLSAWWRDYVYVPIGGRRRGGWRAVAAVSSVFLLSGIWHGAGVGFLLWGAFHGVAVLLERSAVRMYSAWPLLRRSGVDTWGRPVWVGLTVVFVSVCWLPFLAGPERETPELLGRLAAAFGGGVGTLRHAGQLVAADALIVALAITVTVVAHRMESWYWRRDTATRLRVVADVAITNVLVISLLLFGDFGGRSFIYFGF